jgi:hypothetical protein
MIGRICTTLALILIISLPVYAQDEAEPEINGDDFFNYLLLETELEEEPWITDFESDPFDSFWTEMDALFDILTEICIEMEVTDEEVYETFPDLWEPDYEPYLFWEDDWIYWEEE